MIARPAAALVCLLALAPHVARGQSPEAAAERARLGNERIQIEAERRAREEAELQNRALARATEPEAARPAPVESSATDGRAQPAPTMQSPSTAVVMPEPRAPQPDPGAAGDPTSRMLKQLRDLGELKDAGYITEDEFRRIKDRILEGRLGP